MSAETQHSARAGVSGGAYLGDGVDGVPGTSAQWVEPSACLIDAGLVTTAPSLLRRPVVGLFSIVTGYSHPLTAPG